MSAKRWMCSFVMLWIEYNTLQISLETEIVFILSILWNNLINSSANWFEFECNKMQQNAYRIIFMPNFNKKRLRRFKYEKKLNIRNRNWIRRCNRMNIQLVNMCKSHKPWMHDCSTIFFLKATKKWKWNL